MLGIRSIFFVALMSSKIARIFGCVEFSSTSFTVGMVVFLQSLCGARFQSCDEARTIGIVRHKPARRSLYRALLGVGFIGVFRYLSCFEQIADLSQQFLLRRQFRRLR